MSKEPVVDEAKEGKEAWIREMKMHIFIDEPYGCEAIEFYKVVFGAIELKRLYEHIEIGDEKGCVRVVSCELQLGSSTSIIVSELTPKFSWKRTVQGRKVQMRVCVEDVSPVLALALQLGSALEEKFLIDDRLITANIRDPYGIKWSIEIVDKYKHHPQTLGGDITFEIRNKKKRIH